MTWARTNFQLTLALAGILVAGSLLGGLLYTVVPVLFGPKPAHGVFNAVIAGSGLGMLFAGLGHGTGLAIRMLWGGFRGMPRLESDVVDLAVSAVLTPAGIALVYWGIVRHLTICV